MDFDLSVAASRLRRTNSDYVVHQQLIELGADDAPILITTFELAVLTGLSEGTVYKTTRRLELMGVISRKPGSDGTWIRVVGRP